MKDFFMVLRDQFLNLREPENQVSLMKSIPSLMFHIWALKVPDDPNLRLTRPENSLECL